MRSVRTTMRTAMAAVLLFILLSSNAAALDLRCDTAYQDCRSHLLTLIKNEQVALDVAFWFMSDSTLSNAIISRWKAGVPVRILMDADANVAHPGNAPIISSLKKNGLPMRQKTAGGILHWKMMLFAGQNTVEFSGANYSVSELSPSSPYRDYDDEVIFFTDEPSLVNSFKTKYDDVWTTKSGYASYSNAGSPSRRYPTFPKDPELNFPPTENYRTRALARYKAETQGIDVNMFRITDRQHADAMLAAVKRGVPVRLITDPSEYRNPDRAWDSYNVDRMYMGGVTVKMIKHAGLNHEKMILLQSQDMLIFGSSNWSSPSAAYQLEHNLFTTRQDIVDWFRQHWDRKWNNTGPAAETKAFKPLAPNAPRLVSPGDGGSASTSPTLKWYGGRWAHRYDVYVGTSAGSMQLVVSNKELGPSITDDDYQSVKITGLAGGTRYYWKVVGRTMANLAATSSTKSFTTN